MYQSELPRRKDGGALTAVLGPTNTGKTYYAIERLLSHPTGMIGLPLRLLAREVYDKLVARRSAREVALVTGEEKIIPKSPSYWVCTVEAMPLERQVAFLAIDEIQLAGDLERGRIFTSRLLHARGMAETVFLGSETMRPLLKRLFPDINFVTRERLSVLSYAGPKKVTRLPRRSAVVAFSADTVYAVAELIRRQRGGAAVVLGALSPRTRNAQAELYQSGEVDYLVATDAIGLGLNMDIDHVAFAAHKKFDGRGFRALRNDETAQIAGRAGRHLRDGTFGVTADCPIFDEETIEAIENHRFDPLHALQWRSERLEFASLPALINSLSTASPRTELHRARPGDDEEALLRLSRMEEVKNLATGGAALKILWDVCQIPDFQKVSYDEHARLIADIYQQLMAKGQIQEDWLAPKVERLNRTDGNIDALSARIAHGRTWTYLANHRQWIKNAPYWQDKTRVIEDALSDALHEKLTQRFVDRRTSVLLKKLKDDTPILAGVTDDGDVIVEGQFVGRLIGFEFMIDPRAKGADAKRVRLAAEKALTPMLAARSAALANAKPEEFELRDDASLWWRSAPVAQLTKGPTPLRPTITARGLDKITPSLRGRIMDRLQDYIAVRIEALLGPMVLMRQAAEAADGGELTAQGRGVAYRLVENFGAMSRVHFGDELKQLGQDERAKLRKLGMRFGEYTLFMPALLKPGPARLLTLLWALWTGRKPMEFQPPKAGLVSIPVNEDLPHAYYYASGYRPSGARAVRIDMLERLAGQIRNDRKDANGRDGFEASAQMMSLVGCSGEEFEGILKSLGYKKNVVKRPKKKEEPAKVDAATPGETQTLEAPSAASPEGAQSGERASETQIDIASTEGASPTTPQATTEPTNNMPAAIVSPLANVAPTADAQTADSQSAPAGEDKAGPETIGEEELEEVTLWRFAPRRPPQKQRANQDGNADKQARGNRQNHAKGQEGNRKGNKRDSGRRDGARRDGGKGGAHQQRANSPYKGSAKNAPKKGAEGHAPRHRKVADPDSPFAVLAGLKDGLSGPTDKP